MGTTKQINIKNRTYYFYNNIIDLENINARLFKDIGMYNIGYVTRKKLVIV